MFEIMEKLIDFMLELFADDIEMVTKYHEHDTNDGIPMYTVNKTITVQDPEIFALLRNKIMTRIAHKIKADYCLEFAMTQNINELIIFYSEDESEQEIIFTLKLTD